MAQNYADVVAMGARPTGMLIGFAAPPDLPVEWAEEFTAGVRDECAWAGGAVVGGDMVGSKVLTIAVTALGDLEGRTPVRRDGARPGDVVAYTGHLGLSAAGLALLEHGVEGPASCLAEHRRPSPPYASGPEAARLGATAMLDVSDGLLQDLGHIARSSGARLDLASEAFDPDPALLEAVEVLGLGARGVSEAARAMMLVGGEDHALAATFPPEVDLPAHWRTVGTVMPVQEGADGETAIVTVDGNVMSGGGWDHFRRE